MKNSIFIFIISLFLLFMFSCDSGFQKPKLEENGKVVATDKEKSSRDPETSRNCLDACYIKDAYYEIQLGWIKYLYEKDSSSLESPLYDTLIAITEDLILKCTCKTTLLCPRCPKPKPECCDGSSDCPFKDCTSEFISRPECFRSKNKIKYFSISSLDGTVLAKADVSSETHINELYEYDIDYLTGDNYEITIYEFKELNNDIIYSVKFKSN